MRHRPARHAVLACVTTAVLAVTLATPAGAAAPEHERGSATGATEHLRVPSDPAAADGTVSALADVAPAACPRGSRITRTITSTGFETGFPETEYSVGWTRPATDAASGTYAARSQWDAPAPDPQEPGYHDLFLENLYVTPGSAVYLSFASRGSDDFDDVYFGAVSGAGPVYGTDLSPDWTRHTVAVGSGIESDGWLDILFEHEQGDAASWWEVDDVSLFVCGPVPATGVRGDWTADRKVDVLATTPAGELVVYPGTGTGSVSRGFAVGTGWAGMTYLGSPGDINGDKRTDLIARAANGTLYLYAGVGDGVFKKAVPIGQKWNGMTALITSGDVEGNGRPDLMARRNDGTLHLYQFSSTGALTYTRQLGKGWSSMVWLVGVGDLDGDKRGDVLAVNRAGEMYSYKGTATGLVGLGKVGTGWDAATWVTSSGDLNGDGRGDILSRNGDGDLVFHAGQGIGVVGNGTVVDGGWDQFARIL